MIKDSQYWKDYNARRKEYLSQKKRESRAKLKGLVVDTNLPVVDLPRVVDLSLVVDQAPMSTTKPEERPWPKRVVDQPTLPQLIYHWKSGTNYSCASTCTHSYCNNCWYFREDKLIDYKEVGM